MGTRTPAPFRRQLLVALVGPAVLAMLALALTADYVAGRALERALAERLCAIAQAAAAAVNPRVTLLERGDDESRVAKRAEAQLEQLAQATKVGRIFVVLADNLQLLVDTQSGSGVGDEYTRAPFDASELKRVRSGKTAASVLFSGPDGHPYKTGYAPLIDKEGHVAAYVGVAAPATYTNALERLHAAMAGGAILGFALLLGAALWSARRVAIPLSALSEAARHIGLGDLDAEIPTGGPLEAVVLSETMRNMTCALKARDEELQLMLAGIAHEVRNPLGGIELFGGLLKEDLEGDPRQKHVQKILRELTTLSKVVNDFLDFARKRAPEPRALSVYDLCFEVLALAEPDANGRGVDLQLDVPTDLQTKADPESLKRAVLNLVRNAVQAAPGDSGHVCLSARVQDQTLRLVVEDDGAGVPDDKIAEIFTPFFTTKQKGTGLGLALAKKTAVAHGGQINVERAEMGGARFVLSLPHQPS